MIDLLREYSRIMADAPPRCVMIARHDVPFGGAFRMWNTRGEMIVYVSRGWIADLPRGKRKAPTFGFDTTLFAGIPIYFE